MFLQQELLHILITLFMLGLVFGFNDGSVSFDMTQWFFNFVTMFVLAAFFFLVRLWVQKKVGNFYDALVEYRLWITRRYGIKKHQIFRRPLPVGLLLSLLVTFVSLGKLYVTALGHIIITPKLSRIGRKSAQVTEYEESLIAFSGIATHLGWLTLLSWFSRVVAIDFSAAILINAVMLFFLLIPLPPLEGGLIFFGSRNFYIFVLAFSLATYGLLFAGPLLSLILGLLVGIGVLAVYYYKWEF